MIQDYFKIEKTGQTLDRVSADFQEIKVGDEMCSSSFADVDKYELSVILKIKFQCNDVQYPNARKCAEKTLLNEVYRDVIADLYDIQLDQLSNEASFKIHKLIEKLGSIDK
jgi:hypothetical protein